MKVSSSVRYSIKQFINDFLAEYGIFSYRSACMFSKVNGYAAYMEDYYYPFTVFYGASKMCLSFDGMPYVIKIPLYHSLDSDTEKKVVHIMSDNRKKGRYLGFVSIEDLCKTETEMYNAAIKAGIAYCFAAEEKLMTYHGVPVYVQEKIATTFRDSDKFEDVVDDDIRCEIESMINNLGSPKGVCELADNDAFIEDMYLQMGDDFEILLSFIANNFIDDLHDENVGYDFDGNPKIMDYSGFEPRWCDEEVLKVISG